MSRKKTRNKKPVWEHFGAVVTETEISVQTGVNHEVKDRRYRFSDTPVYEYKKYIDIRAVVIWPEEQVGEEVGFWIYEMSPDVVKQTLGDLHLKNKRTGEYRYQKYRGESEPVYGEPKPIGWLEIRGKNDQGKQVWWGHAEVPDEARTHIMSILLGSKQAYFHVTGTRARNCIELTNVSISLGDSGDWEELEKLKAMQISPTDQLISNR